MRTRKIPGAQPGIALEETARCEPPAVGEPGYPAAEGDPPGPVALRRRLAPVVLLAYRAVDASRASRGSAGSSGVAPGRVPPAHPRSTRQRLRTDRLATHFARRPTTGQHATDQRSRATPLLTFADDKSRRLRRPRRRPGHRRQVLPLAPADRHRQVQRPRRNPPRHRGRRRADRHRRDPPHQHRPEPGRAEPARRAAAGPLHDPAQHRRLLHRRRCRAHLPPGARAARRPQAGQARSAGRPADAVPRRGADARGRRNAGQGRLRRDGLHLRRSDPGQAPGGDRLRRGDAAGRADRLGPGHPEPLQPAGDRREREGADHRRCRRRHRVRRRDRDGAGLRRRADEHRDRRRAAIRC